MKKNLSRNKFSTRIAFDIKEVVSFEGSAVVVDIFRFSTTLCALLASGRKRVYVYSNPELALMKSKIDGFDLFSEIELDTPRRFDNSPFLALEGKNLKDEALIVTRAGSPTVMSLRRAGKILIGCFANMPFLVDYLKDEKDSILIVPACIFYNREHVEDFIGCETIYNALNGKDTFNAALLEIHKSGRIMDFLSTRPGGKRDLEIILQKGTMKTVPKAEIRGIFAEITEGLKVSFEKEQK